MSAGEDAMATLIRWANLPNPVREHPFSPPRRWRFDFAWPAFMVALEVEGGTWVQGRHSRGAGYEADLEKYDEAAIQGWRVLRVSTAMVDDGRALAFLERVLTP